MRTFASPATLLRKVKRVDRLPGRSVGLSLLEEQCRIRAEKPASFDGKGQLEAGDVALAERRSHPKRDSRSSASSKMLWTWRLPAELLLLALGSGMPKGLLMIRGFPRLQSLLRR